MYLVKGLILLVTSVGALFFSLPFLWMLSTAVKPPYEVWVMPPKWIPSSISFRNFVEPWDYLPFLTFYRNTVTVVIVTMIGTLTSSSLVAYGFARLRFPGRGILFVILLSTMMLPAHITLIPLYLLYTWVGWVNTLLPLTVPSFFGAAFNIFLLRQFIMTISPELDDAARIDGASYFGIYSRIVLPLIKPALGVVAIFSFTYHWNDFLHPLIYLNSTKWFTIALGLRLIQSRTDIQIQYTMAMTVVSLIPVLTVFFLAQRYFIQGIVVTGIKG